LTPNELVLTFGGLHLCVKFGENRQKNATVRLMTHGQTDRQTDRRKPILLSVPWLYAIAMGQIITRYMQNVTLQYDILSRNIDLH